MKANATRLLATLDEAADKFAPRSEGTAGVVVLLVVLLVALVAIGAYIVLRLTSLGRRRESSDTALFHELADAHNLGAADRKYLLALARRETLDDPALVFVQKHHLEACAKSSPDPTPRALFDRLFG